jgi:hypothetical protein
MAYEIGFVDNAGSEGVAHWQMLLKIKTFAEANGWTTLRYLNPGPFTNSTVIRELILQGKGLSGTDQIFIGFRAYQDQTADYYNLSVAAFTGYVAGNTFITQPGYSESGVPSHNNRIDYWLTVNAQRIAFGLKVGTPVYECGYVGKFLPYATPSQYPYPVVVAGMLSGVPATRFSDSTHSIPYKGNRANFRMRFVDGSWKTPETWPWNNTYVAGNINQTQLRDTGNSYSLLPVVLTDTGPNVYGELDGIFYISGFNNATENTLTIAGVTYVVLQDVSRNGFADYVAMRLN